MSVFVQGHSEELWAIAGHPTEPEFVTAGYDQTVMLWHFETHQLLWKTSVEVLFAVFSAYAVVRCPSVSVTFVYSVETGKCNLIFFTVW